MNKIITTLLLSAYLLLNTPLATAAELIITLENIQSSEGTLRLAVFEKADEYTDNNINHALQTHNIKPVLPTTNITLHQLQPGKYAVQVYHDENNDKALNRTFFGAPDEPYGFSNQAYAAFSRPAFDEVAIKVSEPSSQIKIRLAMHSEH